MTMADVPIQIVVAAFNSQDGASQALKSLKEAQGAGLVTIDNVAVLIKDADGKLDVNEPTDWGGGRGAVVGGVTGAALGLLAGPVGWAIGLGALVGGLAAKLRDSGFSDERLRKLGESLKPGTSAIVAVVEHRWVAQLEKQLAEEGANTLTEEISSDIARELEAGRDVAYSALSAAGVVAIDRAAVGKDTADVASIVATQDSVTVTGVSIRPESGEDAAVPAGEAGGTESKELEDLPKAATPATSTTS
jgi:uncharacterized membrane protein